MQEKHIGMAKEVIAKVREQSPLVMCVTNSVVTNWSANCLLAIGATPAMIDETSEAVELAKMSGAVLINVGTVTERQSQVMFAAAKACAENGIKWVLDPVAADKLSFRREVVRELLQYKPTLIRGNAGEIDFMRREMSELISGCQLLSTGKIDRLYGKMECEIDGGVGMLTRVTGTGCAQGALAAAFCAVTDAGKAAVTASVTMKMAGEMAYEHSRMVGSFQIALLDSLGEL